METQKINTKKQILRKQIREKNAHLDPEYCLWADKRIREWILNWKYFQKAETIFCFVGTAGEIHTKPLIQAALDQGKRVAVPKCISKGSWRHGRSVLLANCIPEAMALRSRRKLRDHRAGRNFAGTCSVSDLLWGRPASGIWRRFLR